MLFRSVMNLRPVAFRYKQADETGGHPLQYGLIAEEVAKVAPDLVQYDKAGKPFTVRYHLLTPMLLSELQKQHKEVKALRAELAAQKAKVAKLERVQSQQLADLVKQVAELRATQRKGKTSLAGLH